MTRRTLVTLIHGTFALGAPWTRRGSRLCAAIREAFPGEVEFERLTWSGANTTQARAHAAEKLKERIARRADAGFEHHFLIGHSHGGNIAMYALGNAEAPPSITGVATLATPFLSVKRRDLGASGVAVFCMGFFVWGVALAELARWAFWPGLQLFHAFVVVPAVLLLAGCLVLVPWRRAKALTEGLRLGSVPRGRLWIGRVTGDEASALIQAAQFAGTIVARLHLLFVRAQAWAEALRLRSLRKRRVLAVIGAVIVAGAILIRRWLRADEAPDVVQWMALAVFGVGMAIALWGLFPLLVLAPLFAASAIVAPLALVLAFLLILPVGARLAAYSLLLDVSAEATPVGEWTVHHYEPVRCDALPGTPVVPGMAHSGIYDHPDVLRDLVTWMRQRIDR